MIKNALYFNLKALFIEFLSGRFSYVEKRLD